MKVFIDANVFVFALIDSSSLGERAGSLLDEISRGKMQGVTSVLVIDEVIWALMKNKKPVALIENYVRNMYEQKNLFIEAVTPDVPLKAFKFIENYNLKPRDAMHCAFMETAGISAIVSDDGDFDDVKEVKRLPL